MSVFRKHCRIWRGKNTLEMFLLEYHKEVIVAGGLINGNDLQMRYKVFLDRNWAVQKVHLGLLNAPFSTLFMEQVEPGKWMDGLGNHLLMLDGCTDIDISATPFTNTIPIKRMAQNRMAKFKVAYINSFNLTAHSVSQIYTNKGCDIYRYENLNSLFCADISVDVYGLIVDYPKLFQAIYVNDEEYI
ncbi:putative glycolipid-binding domain-containing protein [Pedobacter sp.]|jgi:hypothetical protein|uniref:putative glycolipid-binding domain-containing protein n=1 Tax=Pedobacter sp. TaxID=1411316 RepID=UPI002D0863DD|nr:putative glycolipid-binding domain-containing protein [Pedobacter sp.]HWW41620.1 putative glycolipid-binding domain-containing protein [Pedobacter sp.]